VRRRASDEDEEAHPRPPVRLAIQDGGVFHPTAAHPTVRRDDDYDDDDERRLAVADSAPSAANNTSRPSSARTVASERRDGVRGRRRGYGRRGEDDRRGGYEDTGNMRRDRVREEHGVSIDGRFAWVRGSDR